MSITLKAAAKINIFLDILGKLENKFENTIKTIKAFCQIDLSVTRKSEEECKKKEEDLLYNIYTAKDVIA